MSSEAPGNIKTAALKALHRRSPTFSSSPDYLDEDIAVECEQENGASQVGSCHSPVGGIPSGLAPANRAQGQPRGKAMQKLRKLVRSPNVNFFQSAKFNGTVFLKCRL